MPKRTTLFVQHNGILSTIVAVAAVVSGSQAVNAQPSWVYTYIGPALTADPANASGCPGSGGNVTATIIYPAEALAISAFGQTVQGFFNNGDFAVDNSGRLLQVAISGGAPPNDSLSSLFNVGTIYGLQPSYGADLVETGNGRCAYRSSSAGFWSNPPPFQTSRPKTLGGSAPPSNPAGQADPASGIATMNLGCPNANCGNPINAATGNKFQTETDFVGGLNSQLSFTRSYNSQDGTSAGLGVGWHSTYHRGLAFGGTAAVVTRADGRVDTFLLNNGTWTSDTDVTSVLTPVPATGTQTGWTLTLVDDSVETYTLNGQLTSITARSGLTTTLTYNGSNQLVAVTGPFGQTLTFTYDSSGRLYQMVTPDAKTFAYAYDGNSNLISVTNPDSTIRQYVYENSNFPDALTGIIDEDGNRFATWAFDSSGRAISSQHAGGADLTTITYTASSSTVTNALGQQLTYGFATLQNVPKVTSIARSATTTTAAATRTFTYDSNGFLASATDWDGNQTTYLNDARGEPTTINEAVGAPQARTTTITYLSNYHLPSQIVTPGLTTNFTYDSGGDLLTKTLTDTTTTTTPYSTNAQARTWTYTWSNSLLGSAKSPNANTTNFTYDSSGALIKTKNALSQTTQVTTHTASGWPQVIVDPNGVTTTLTYDTRLRLLSSAVTTGAGVRTTEYGYDAAGNLITLTLPDNSALTNTYDAAHRLIGTVDLFTNSIAYTLDAFGDRTNTVVSNAATTVTRQHSGTFDALGRLLGDVGGVGQTTAYGYDSNGNAVTITDPLQRLTQQGFDALNRVNQVTDPAMGNTGISYDAHDRPLSVTDPNGNTTSYTYDGFWDVIQEVSPARGTTVYRYDLDGNLTQKTDARGANANYTYDALDRVTATTYPADAAENVTYIYDQAAGGFGIGRLTSVTDAAGTLSRTYDERGNILSESRVRGTGPSAVTLLTKYAYDAASRIASITYPSGTVVAYTRDAMGRVTAVTEKALGAAAPTTVLSNVTYQPFGPPRGLTYGNGVAESRSFDLDYRLTSVAGTGNNPIQHLGYGYNAANDVLSMTDAVTAGNSQTFGYDVLDRLTSASGGYGVLAYTYDANGNRLTENPAAPITLDGIGSSITTLAYNQAGRLASTRAGTTQITQYSYDAFGQRLSKVGNVTTTLFQYGIGGELLEETNTQGNAEADYIYLDGRPVAEITPPTGGQLYFLHDDRLGTPQVATNTSQATVWIGNYQPFGALNTVTSQTALLGEDLRFPGQENDLETGLYHNGFREYAPGLGRYTQSDPIGIRGGINTYQAVKDNPLKYTDRSGLDSDAAILNNPVLRFIGNNPNVGYYLMGGGASLVFGGAVAACSAAAVGMASVFWSGYGSELAAETWAIESGGQTLSLSQFAVGEAETAEAVQAASISFAETASGSIQVFQPAAGVPINSIWSQFEYPALLQNPRVTTIVYNIIDSSGNIIETIAIPK